MTFLPFTWGSLRLRWRDFYGGHEKRLSRKSLLMERMIVMILLYFQPQFVTLLRNGNVQMVENALINAEDVMDIRIVPIFQTRTKIFAQIVILLFIEKLPTKNLIFYNFEIHKVTKFGNSRKSKFVKLLNYEISQNHEIRNSRTS